MLALVVIGVGKLAKAPNIAALETANAKVGPEVEPKVRAAPMDAKTLDDRGAELIDSGRARRAKLAEKLKTFYAQHSHADIQEKAIEFRAAENRLFLEKLGVDEQNIRNVEAIIRERDKELGRLRLDRLTNPNSYDQSSVTKSNKVMIDAQTRLRRVIGEDLADEFERWEASRKSKSAVSRGK